MAAQPSHLGPPLPQWAAALAGHFPVLFDGRGPDSWGDGCARFAAFPRAVLTMKADGTSVVQERNEFTPLAGDPFDLWQDFLDRAAVRRSPAVATALAYDLKHWIERHDRRLPWPPEPLLFAAEYGWAYEYSHRTGAGRLLGDPPADVPYLLRTAIDHAGCALPDGVCLSPQMPAAAYKAMIRRALEYIAAGDVYQVNLAQTFRAELSPSHAPTLFAALQGLYPMPFAALIEAGDHWLVSVSPECFLLVDGRTVRTFPIKGTRRLGSGTQNAVALDADPKECAEHIMIVDLERNDLGRVCRTGTVRASPRAHVRPFPLLEHMVSEVRGRLRDEVTLSQLLRAVFPGGSITGAPKVRAMEIIEELEPTPRGVYTGAIGWVEPGRGARFNVAIRTAVIGPDGLRYAAGGGIVADSVPEREYDETLLKAEALSRCLSRGPIRPDPGGVE